MDFIHDLKEAFHALALPQNAGPMEAYMKNRFPFLGIKTTERRTVFKELLKTQRRNISKRACYFSGTLGVATAGISLLRGRGVDRGHKKRVRRK